MPSDADRVKNGEPVGPGEFNGGQKALGPATPLAKTGSSAVEPYAYQIPHRGRSKPTQQGMYQLPASPQAHLENGGTTTTGSEPRDLDRIVNGGNGSNGNGGRRRRGNGNGNGNDWTNGAGGNGNGNGGSRKSKKKGPGRISKGVGGVGKGILKGIYEHRPGYGRRQEEVLARPRAEAIAQEQFGITEDTTQITHYDILGVRQTASQEDIRKAYIAKAAVLHPDVNPGQEAADAMILLNQAKEVLLDEPQPQKRNAYNKSLQRPGSYEAMTPGMRKKAMSQARTGMKYEQDIKNEAHAMGIPLYTSTGGSSRKVRYLSVEQRRAWADQQGIAKDVTDEELKAAPHGNQEWIVPATKTKRSVQELAIAIQAQKGSLQTQKTFLAEAEDEYKELRPSKRVKASRAAGKAISGGAGMAGGLTRGLAQLSGQAIKSSGRSGIGREVRSQGSSNLGALRDIQSPALGRIRAAGAGGVRKRQGALGVQTPFGKLPITGKPAVRKRKKGF